MCLNFNKLIYIRKICIFVTGENIFLSWNNMTKFLPSLARDRILGRGGANYRPVGGAYHRPVGGAYNRPRLNLERNPGCQF